MDTGMTQKVKSSPSLKGILKKELAEEFSGNAKEIKEELGVRTGVLASEIDHACKKHHDLEESLADRFHSVYARISDLERTATDTSISWEDLYWIIAVAAMLLIVIYFVITKATEQ
jgi:hypothetical protein